MTTLPPCPQCPEKVSGTISNFLEAGMSRLSHVWKKQSFEKQGSESTFLEASMSRLSYVWKKQSFRPSSATGQLFFAGKEKSPKEMAQKMRSGTFISLD